MKSKEDHQVSSLSRKLKRMGAIRVGRLSSNRLSVIYRGDQFPSRFSSGSSSFGYSNLQSEQKNAVDEELGLLLAFFQGLDGFFELSEGSEATEMRENVISAEKAFSPVDFNLHSGSSFKVAVGV